MNDAENGKVIYVGIKMFDDYVWRQWGSEVGVKLRTEVRVVRKWRKAYSHTESVQMMTDLL